jgi:hypothetical protein
VLAGAGQPRGDGTLIQTTGGNHRLDRTAMAAQGQPPCHHVRRGPQPVAGRARGGGEALATRGALLALLSSAMHAHVPLPHLASGWAVLMVAAWGLRVHRWPPLDAFVLSQANHVPKDARGTRFFQTMSHLLRLTVAVPRKLWQDEYSLLPFGGSNETGDGCAVFVLRKGAPGFLYLFTPSGRMQSAQKVSVLGML